MTLKSHRVQSQGYALHTEARKVSKQTVLFHPIYYLR